MGWYLSWNQGLVYGLELAGYNKGLVFDLGLGSEITDWDQGMELADLDKGNHLAFIFLKYILHGMKQSKHCHCGKISESSSSGQRGEKHQ